MIVVDASLVVGAMTMPDGLAGEALRRQTAVASPAHLDAEVGHALRGLVRGGLLAQFEAQQCIGDLAISRVTRAPLAPLALRAFALRDNMTFYDALYVALAESLDVPLYTIDAKFSRVPNIGCDIEVIALS